MLGEELCGVIVYCYPPSACYERRLVLPRMTMQEMNAKLSLTPVFEKNDITVRMWLLTVAILKFLLSR